MPDHPHRLPARSVAPARPAVRDLPRASRRRGACGVIWWSVDLLWACCAVVGEEVEGDDLGDALVMPSV